VHGVERVYNVKYVYRYSYKWSLFACLERYGQELENKIEYFRNQAKTFLTVNKLVNQISYIGMEKHILIILYLHMISTVKPGKPIEHFVYLAPENVHFMNQPAGLRPDHFRLFPVGLWPARRTHSFRVSATLCCFFGWLVTG